MANIILDLVIIGIYTLIIWRTWRDRMMASRSALLAASIAAILAFGADLVQQIGLTEADFKLIYRWERTMITFSVLAMGLYQLLLIKRNWVTHNWNGEERRRGS